MQTIKDNYANFEVDYNGTDNDDYVNGGGFCCDDKPMTKSFVPQENDNPELFQYYYHSDHLGSSSLITNLDGEVVQHIEYVPFGEVFIEERNNKWNTPYLFNAKELDEETGLYYYGARYYDPRTSVWLSTDPLQEKYPNISTYAYTALNPVKYIDPDGKDWLDKVAGIGIGIVTNIISGSTDLRNVYTPNDKADYNKALKATDVASAATGTIMVVAGIAEVAAGGGTAAGGGAIAVTGVGAPVGGVVAAVGGVIAAKGAIEIVVGGLLVANSAMHLSSEYDYGKKETDTSSSGSSSGSDRNFKKITDSQLKDSGIDAHQLKKDFLGNKVKISRYDLYKDNKTGEILILEKGGKGTPINTGEIIQ